MSLQQKIKSLVCSLNERNILKLFQSIEQVLNQKIQINCRVISYKFYEATINFNVLKSNGYGRSDIEANNNCKKNFLELLVEDENAVPLFKNALRKIQAEQQKSNQTINTSMNYNSINQSILNQTDIKDHNMSRQEQMLNQSQEKNKSFDKSSLLNQSQDKKDSSFNNYNNLFNKSHEKIAKSLEKQEFSQEKLNNSVDKKTPNSMSILKSITQKTQQLKPGHAPKSNSMQIQKNESLDLQNSEPQILQKASNNYKSEKQLVCCTHESQLQLALSKIKSLEEKVKQLTDENKILKSIYHEKMQDQILQSSNKVQSIQDNSLNNSSQKNHRSISDLYQGINQKSSSQLQNYVSQNSKQQNLSSSSNNQVSTSIHQNQSSLSNKKSVEQNMKNEQSSLSNKKTDFQELKMKNELLQQQIFKASQVNNKPPSYTQNDKPNKENLGDKKKDLKTRSISYDFQGIKQNILQQKQKAEIQDLNTSNYLNNSSQDINKSREGSLKKQVPKLNLNKIPNFHGNFQSKVLPQYNIFK